MAEAKESDSLSGWDRGIADSQEMIKEAKERIKVLKRGIQHFAAMRQRGVPFPGERHAATTEKRISK